MLIFPAFPPTLPDVQHAHSPYKDNEPLATKLGRVIVNAKRLSRGYAEAEAIGIQPTFLRQRSWQEVVLTSHICPCGTKKSFKKWKKSDTNLCFQDWLIAHKGPEWFYGGKHTQPNGTVFSFNVRFLDDPAPYEAIIEQGKLILSLASLEGNPNNKLFILSPKKKLYVASEIKGTFHHSSFVEGGVVIAAGEIGTNQDQKIIHVRSESGHYRPVPGTLLRFFRYLISQKADLTDVNEVLVRYNAETKIKYASVYEFFSHITTLSGGSCIEIIATLRMIKAYGVDISRITIQRMPGSESVSISQFFAELNTLEACEDEETVQESLLFLQEEQFDFSKIYKVVTPPNVSAIGLLKTLLSYNPELSLSSLQIEVCPIAAYQFDCTLEAPLDIHRI